MEKSNQGDMKEMDNEHPIELFRRGMNADATFRSYNKALRSVLCTALEDVLHGTYEERAAEFVEIGKKDPIRARNIITQLVTTWSKQAETGSVGFETHEPRDDQGGLEPDQETNGHE